MSKIVLGFSGGVDSAVSAALLRKQGFEVHGLYLNTGDEASLRDAVTTAAFLDIPLEIGEVKTDMERLVCRPFEACYLSGRTPIPCIICNPVLKFRKLLEEADRIGAERIATGHYARAENGALFRGRPANDQSYMLCRLTREQVSRSVFPLGDLEKLQVRELAGGLRLPVAKKPDSQEICFIPSRDYREWLRQRGNIPQKGSFYLHGEPFGTHDGIWNYTVGQRLPGFYEGRKLYISRILPEVNVIELAWWEELFSTKLTAEKFNWLIDPPKGALTAKVQVRHTRWEVPDCTAECSGSYVKINCASEVRAPAPGQTAALYKDDRVLGGGFLIDPSCAEAL